MKRTFIKRFLSIVITLVILSIIYSRANLSDLGKIALNLQPFYLFIALLLFGTHFLLTGWRWSIIVRTHCSLSISESIQFILACSPLNLFLPAKSGSFAKAFFMKEKGYLEAKPAFSMVFYERFSDVAALSLIFIFSFLLTQKVNALIMPVLIATSFFLILYLCIHAVKPDFFKRKKLFEKYGKTKIIKIFNYALDAVFDYIIQVKKQKKSLLKINFISLMIWTNSIIQFVFFFKMLRFQVPISTIFLNIPCAILIGLLPISISGIGTRDAAIIYLFKGFLSYNEAISIGILSILRYVLPALIGLSFFNILMFNKNMNFSLKQNVENENKIEK